MQDIFFERVFFKQQNFIKERRGPSTHGVYYGNGTIKLWCYNGQLDLKEKIKENDTKARVQSDKDPKKSNLRLRVVLSHTSKLLAVILLLPNMQYYTLPPTIGHILYFKNFVWMQFPTTMSWYHL